MSTSSNLPTNRRLRRTVKDLEANQRSAALSQLYRAAEAAAPPNYPPEWIFSSAAVWEWVRGYLAYVFHKRHYFPAASASPTNGIYDLVDENNLSEKIKVSIAGDWGTGTLEAASVATQIHQLRPHFTIHLGDVYYVGDPPSINENCLGIKNPNNNYIPVNVADWNQGRFCTQR
jgi:hypothetical protein